VARPYVLGEFLLCEAESLTPRNHHSSDAFVWGKAAQFSAVDVAAPRATPTASAMSRADRLDSCQVRLIGWVGGLGHLGQRAS
jgi:hypothetical protein